MLKWAIIFALISLATGAFGFSEFSSSAKGIAKFIFLVFLILFVGVLIAAMIGVSNI
ncbi:MAG: hypothetical protein JWM78_3299 [Verrucomicrobiaceae bacterium]|nr:hypothetical protein [Verrucomicrobiaceae bacterium]